MHWELQENTGKRFNDIRKTTEEQNEKFNKEIKNIRKNQTNSGAEGLNKQDEECIRKPRK